MSTKTKTASVVSAPVVQAAVKSSPVERVADVQVRTGETKMEAAGRKAAAKSKATERASFALIYSFEFAGAAGLATSWDKMKSEEWAGLALARAIREAVASNHGAADALQALSSAEKPRGSAVVAGVASATIKESKGARYVIVRIMGDDDVGGVDDVVTIVREAGRISIIKSKS